MKIATRLIKLLVVFACAAFSTAAFGQATHIWSGAGDGTNLDTAANWDGTLPSTANNDEGQFNGATAGNLLLNYSLGNFQSGPGQAGITFHMTPNQTGSVQFTTSFNDSHTSGGSGSLLLAIVNVTVDAGAGPFTLGPSDPTKLLGVVGRPNGATHVYDNESANTATINPRILWKAGGGAAFTFDFKGAGNWQVNNNLMNDNGPGITVIMDGPGTMFWNPAVSYQNANSLLSPVAINAGKLVLQSPHARWGNQAITLGGTLEFDAPALAQTFSGVISDLPSTVGSGTLQVNNGTLTLSSTLSTYTGKTLLSGGELFVNSAEVPGSSGPLGFGGPISFTGGTLGYSVNNVYDYSSRFATTAGQLFRIDTAGQNVAFTNATGLTSTGGVLTKLGSGTLTLAGLNAYGDTFISAGKLLFQGTKSGAGNITVSNSTILGVTENGSQISPATLTVGTTASATLEFNSVNSTTLAPLAAGTIVAGGPITINVASGSFAVGQSYPLFTWTSGTAPAVTLGTLTGAVGNLTTNGSKIQLNITGLAYVWTGLADGNWDLTTANDWKVNGVSTIWSDGNAALFDDTATLGQTNITLNSAVAPAGTTVNSSLIPYTITSSGANNIGGSGGLTKNGNSVLTLTGGANTYTGPTTLGLGTVSVSALANGGAASDIGQANNTAASVVFNGGTLQYVGGANAAIDRLFTLTPAGGAIDSEGGTLTLNNTGAVGLTGTGARTLTLRGSSGLSTGDTLAAVIADNGGATAVTKNGTGLWILTGNSTYSGLTTIANGALQIGTGGANGSIGTGNIVNSGRLDFNVSGTTTIPGVISGSGSLTNDAGTLIFTGNNTYGGNTTINAGTLQLGNGGATGTINGNTAITVNGTLILNSTVPLLLANFGNNITGTGNVIIRSGAFLNSQIQNNYTGWTQIDPGGTFQPTYGNSGTLASSVVTNNGTLLFLQQAAWPADAGSFAYSNNIVGTGRVVKENNNQNAGVIGFMGTNTYTGGTFIAGGGIILGDNTTPGTGSIVGDVVFTNTVSGQLLQRRFIFNRPDTITFPGNITSVVTDGSSVANSGLVEQDGTGTTILTGNNTYPGGTTITAGTIQVGNGGATGSIGNGPVIDNGTLLFNRSGALTVPGIISGGGVVIQVGPGTVSLTATNTYGGSTTISNGTLAIIAVAADVNVNGGTLAAGIGSTPANVSIPGSLNWNLGNVSVPLNDSLVTSNSFITAGAINYTSGSLVLNNAGPALKVGDRFVIFNQLVPNGHTIPIVASGFTVRNDLEIDGSVTVLTVSTLTKPTLSKPFLSNGTNIVITATNNAGPGGTYTLLGTNNLTAPLSTWPVISTGTFDSTGQLFITNAVKNGTLFYYLRVP